MEPHEEATRSEYPVHFSIEYPDRTLDRFTTAFRLSCLTHERDG